MIKVYYGPMGSGKTKKLLDEHDKIYHKQKIMVFSPIKDDRFGVGVIQDRSGRRIDSIPVYDIFEIEDYLNNSTYKIRYVFIDEVNFFESEVKTDIDLNELIKRREQSVQLLQELSIKSRINFYIFGLNLTAEMYPYGLMPSIMSCADELVEQYAECADCGDNHARYTYYIPVVKETNVVGEKDYCSLCGPCYYEWKRLFYKLKETGQIDEYYELAKGLKPSKEKIGS